MENALLLVTMVLYLLSSVYFLLATRGETGRLKKRALIGTGAGAALNLAILVWRAVAGRYFPLTNLFESLSLLACCISLGFLVAYLKYRDIQIGGLALPLATLVLLAAILVPGPAREPVLHWRTGWIVLHAATALISYGAFALAFVAGVMFVLQERELKRKKPGILSRWLPPLEKLEATDRRAIEVGFPLLTFAIMCGLLWAKLVPTTGWSWGWKETWSLITWLSYAALLHVKRTYSLRGRKVAYLCIIGFVLVLFTFVGGSLLFSGLHQYDGR